MRVFELFDSLFPMSDVTDDGMSEVIHFKDSSGALIEVSLGYFGEQEDGIYGAAFTRNGSTEVTGDGEEFKIFSTVIAAIGELNRKVKPRVLFFGADLTHGNRANLYRRLVVKFAAANGYTVKSIKDVDPVLQKIGGYFEGEEVFFLISKDYVPTYHK